MVGSKLTMRADRQSMVICHSLSLCSVFFCSVFAIICYVISTIGGHLGWLRLFWQPSILYLSHLYSVFVFVCTCIVENKISSSSSYSSSYLFVTMIGVIYRLVITDLELKSLFQYVGYLMVNMCY